MRLRDFLESLLVDEKVCDADAVLETLRREFGARSCNEDAKRSIREACTRIARAHAVLTALHEALDAAEGYGWAWPHDESVAWFDLGGSSRPYLGDDASSEWVDALLDKTASSYVGGTFFRPRKGLRGQTTEHAALDARSGLTEEEGWRREEARRERMRN